MCDAVCVCVCMYRGGVLAILFLNNGLDETRTLLWNIIIHFFVVSGTIIIVSAKKTLGDRLGTTMTMCIQYNIMSVV